MPNYLTEMHKEIGGTREDIEKLKSVFDFFAKFGDELEAWSDEDFRETGLNFSPERSDLFRSIARECMGNLGVKIELYDGTANHIGLGITSGESINVEATARILQDWIKEIGSDEPVQFEWANTCSKSVVDGFGGGAVHITRDTIEYLNTNDWMDEKLNEAMRDAEKEMPGPG